MFKTAVFVRFQPLRKRNELDWLSIFPSEQYRLLIASHYATLRETVAFTMGVLKAHARISRPGCPQTTRSDRFNLHDSPKVRAKHTNLHATNRLAQCSRALSERLGERDRPPSCQRCGGKGHMQAAEISAPARL